MNDVTGMISRFDQKTKMIKRIEKELKSKEYIGAGLTIWLQIGGDDEGEERSIPASINSPENIEAILEHTLAGLADTQEQLKAFMKADLVRLKEFLKEE